MHIVIEQLETTVREKAPLRVAARLRDTLGKRHTITVHVEDGEEVSSQVTAAVKSYAEEKSLEFDEQMTLNRARLFERMREERAEKERRKAAKAANKKPPA